MKKIVLLSCNLYFVFCINALAASSPVVQVVSYKEPLGLYFSLQWWGSGSIIDKQGHIITNSHVVDDGRGGVSDDFAICMTDDPMLPPRCHYTASVINRDADADIAVLQLDSVDIFGKKVDFDALSTLTMNMEYIPHSGDMVVARGYPWVGANTITETQGIVSGTAQYNGNTYIKTDTLIAGGNSGGPLIHDGEIVWINTFLVGGGYDPSLGYSLLMSEADDFISAALSSGTKIQKNTLTFPEFLKKIETFSSQKKITDPLISVNLSEKYMITSYIPAVRLSASLSDADSTSVSSFSFQHIRTPRIKNLAELQSYLTSELGAPKMKLTPVVLWGSEFYELSQEEDIENTKTQSTYVYLSIVDETHLLFLFLETPIPTKNTLSSIQKSVKDFLSNITFPGKFVFPDVENVVIPWSGIGIMVRPQSAITYDMSEYSGLLRYSISNWEDFVMVKNYLGNSWSKAQISVFKNSFETEDDSLDTWIKNTTNEMHEKPVINKKIRYQWHEWFLVCSEDTIWDASYQSHDIIDCELVLFLGESHEYIISTQMILEQKQLRRIDLLMMQYLKRTLGIPNIWETSFRSENSLKSLPYIDVADQSRAFQEALWTLILYGVLQSRSLFEWDTPLRWREYLSLYIWSVYHKNISDPIDQNNEWSPTFEQALSVLPLEMDEYAEDDIWQLQQMNNLIRLLVSGGSLPRYDFDTIYDFSNAWYQEEAWVYQDAWDMIYSFESTYFPERVPMKSAEYISQKRITYNPFTDLTIQPKNEIAIISFFRNNGQQKREAEKIMQCDKGVNTYFSLECRDMRKKSLLESLTYPVLTKGKAIEILLGHIDTSLWINPPAKSE